MAREDLCDLLRMGSEKKGNIQQVFCYNAGNENAGGRVDLGSKRRDVHPLSTYLMPWLGKPLGSRGCLLVLCTGRKQQERGREVRRGRTVPQGMGEDRDSCLRGSAAELGMRPGDWIWENKAFYAFYAIYFNHILSSPPKSSQILFTSLPIQFHVLSLSQ